MADQGSQGILSAFLRRKRVAAARPCLNGSVLDYGCGSGAVAEHVPPQQYVGYDRDLETIDKARIEHPDHTFVTEPPGGQFDTVVLLAVLEHVFDPTAFLRDLADRLADGGRLVLTTPHPRMEWAHTVGAKVGLFSHDAHEEHEALLDRAMIEQVATGAGLVVETYQRFLFGANQLAVLRRN